MSHRYRLLLDEEPDGQRRGNYCAQGDLGTVRERTDLAPAG
jgi:hypothetical protein